VWHFALAVLDAHTFRPELGHTGIELFPEKDLFRKAHTGSSSKRAREEDVVLEMDVLVERSLQRSKTVPERAPGVACLRRHFVAVGQLPQTPESGGSRVVLLGASP